jgi:hypothetical protein
VKQLQRDQEGLLNSCNVTRRVCESHFASERAIESGLGNSG